MKKIKKYLITLLFITIITIPIKAYCNVETKDNPPNINSRAAIVFDRTSKTIIYGKNENQQRKMASTTKIMTALIVVENCNLTDIVQVSKKAASTQGSRLGLIANAKITVNDLLYGLMLCSGNDAAVALAEHTAGSVENFVNMMNNKAQDLGLQNTKFVTPHGLDDDNHYTTAYELAILADYAMQNETISKIVCTKNYTVTINNSPKNIHNTNELLGNLNGVYGIKTGFTNGANRCLVTACKRGNLDVICVVLGADTKNFRSQDSTKLLEYTFSNYQMVNIEELINNKFYTWKNENILEFKINKMLNDSILDLEFSKLSTPIIPIKNSLIDDINIDIISSYFFEAPLKSQSSVGKIIVTCNDTELLQLDILIKYDIKRKTVLDNFFDIFTNYKYYMEVNF